VKIITVHLNNLEGFELTFQSVKHFIIENGDIEWIIKDGISDTNHLNAIVNKTKDLPRTKVVSIKDIGVYDAMNQALNLVDDDDLVLFLNSGDRLANDFMKNHQRGSLYHGDVYYSDTFLGTSHKLLAAPDQIDFSYLLSKTINHQSLIIRGFYLKKYLFKLNYSIVADWVQLFEIFKNESIRFEKLVFPICIYEGGGISERNDDLRKTQRLEFLKTQYTQWELNSLMSMSRLRQRPWYSFVIKSLDSPKRSKILYYLSKLMR